MRKKTTVLYCVRCSKKCRKNKEWFFFLFLAFIFCVFSCCFWSFSPRFQYSSSQRFQHRLLAVVGPVLLETFFHTYGFGWCVPAHPSLRWHRGITKERRCNASPKWHVINEGWDAIASVWTTAIGTSEPKYIVSLNSPSTTIRHPNVGNPFDDSFESSLGRRLRNRRHGLHFHVTHKSIFQEYAGLELVLAIVEQMRGCNGIGQSSR